MCVSVFALITHTKATDCARDSHNTSVTCHHVQSQDHVIIRRRVCWMPESCSSSIKETVSFLGDCIGTILTLKPALSLCCCRAGVRLVNIRSTFMQHYHDVVKIDGYLWYHHMILSNSHILTVHDNSQGHIEIVLV